MQASRLKKSNQLFGDTLHFAQQLCTIAGNMQVAMSSTVKELVLKDHFQNRNTNFFDFINAGRKFTTDIIQHIRS